MQAKTSPSSVVYVILGFVSALRVGKVYSDLSVKAAQKYIHFVDLDMLAIKPVYPIDRIYKYKKNERKFPTTVKPSPVATRLTQFSARKKLSNTY